MTHKKRARRSAGGAGASSLGPKALKPADGGAEPQGWVSRFLNLVERAGNVLPDPSMLFLLGLIVVWAASWWLSGMSFDIVDPRTQAPVQVTNLLSGKALAEFLAGMVTTFAGFPALGVVLVALLGVGVAEHSRFYQRGVQGAPQGHAIVAAYLDADSRRLERLPAALLGHRSCAPGPASFLRLPGPLRRAGAGDQQGSRVRQSAKTS